MCCVDLFECSTYVFISLRSSLYFKTLIQRIISKYSTSIRPHSGHSKLMSIAQRVCRSSDEGGMTVNVHSFGLITMNTLHSVMLRRVAFRDQQICIYLIIIRCFTGYRSVQTGPIQPHTERLKLFPIKYRAVTLFC